MIHHLRGVLTCKAPAEAVVDVGGVGYLLTIPLSTYERLPVEGGDTHLFTKLVVREDSQRLFGFHTREERAFFSLLQGVSGVGPQVALAIVSTLPVGEFRAAVSGGDPVPIRRVKGVGKRLSERLVVELRDRVGELGATAPAGSADADERDAVLALEALGFVRAQAEKAVRTVREDGGAGSDSGDLVRRALRLL